MQTYGNCARPKDCNAASVCPGTLTACFANRLPVADLAVDAFGDDIVDFAKLPRARHAD